MNLLVVPLPAASPNGFCPFPVLQVGVHKHMGTGRVVILMAAKNFTQELKTKVNSYFRKVTKDDTDEFACEHGLAFHLGITVRTLRLWFDGKYPDKKDAEAVQQIIEMAYDRIGMEVQQLVAKGKCRNPVGFANFVLKQKRFGAYQDKVEQKVDTTVKIVHDNSVEESDFK